MSEPRPKALSYPPATLHRLSSIPDNEIFKRPFIASPFLDIDPLYAEAIPALKIRSLFTTDSLSDRHFLTLTIGRDRMINRLILARRFFD